MSVSKEVDQLGIEGLNLGDLDTDGVNKSAPVAPQQPSANGSRQKYIEQLRNLGPKAREALDVFELGVKKEANGSMSDAIEYYRKAMKLDENVEQLYRAKIYAEVPDVEERKGQKQVRKVLDEKAIAKIDVRALLKSFAHEPIHAVDEEQPLLVARLPDDLLQLVMELLIHQDTPSFVAFAMTCKKLSYLGFGANHCWKTLSKLVYPMQNYEAESAQLNCISKDQTKMVAFYDHDWCKMYRERPFVKFNGIYISVVNYYREGGRAEFSSSWNNPIRMITYYRYIRFYPNGTCLKLLTVEEPPHVVPRFSKDWHANGLQKIVKGFWNLTLDGQISINSEGSVDRYRFVENLQIKSSRHRHDRLNWINYEFMDIETTETNNFDIEKEKAYVFSRVKSYREEEV